MVEAELNVHCSGNFGHILFNGTHQHIRILEHFWGAITDFWGVSLDGNGFWDATVMDLEETECVGAWVQYMI